MDIGPWDTILREFVTTCCTYDTTAGNEAPAQGWLHQSLEDAGFDTYTWTGDADTLASHPSFPDDPGAIDVTDRPSVAGVLEFGDPDAGPTLVLNGHMDVVPAGSGWTGDPFDPRWSSADGEDTTRETLTARGAVDMKAGLGACVTAARVLQERVTTGDLDLEGRLVVESVAGEEEGGIGAAAAALENPYPFERDAAIVAEPTNLRPVTAVEGSLMVRVGLEGRSAHAATRWRGTSVLPAFETVRQELERIEAERSESVTHPLYDEFPIPWPICVGRVEAGRWASSVADDLEAEVRVGVAPGETVAEVERALETRLDAVAEDLEEGIEGPTLERFSIQFEPAAIDAREPIVETVRSAMRARGFDEGATVPRGATYGADSRHYVAAGIPTVVFGPGSIEQAHFPEETIEWADVREACGVVAGAAGQFLAS